MKITSILLFYLNTALISIKIFLFYWIIVFKIIIN